MALDDTLETATLRCASNIHDLTSLKHINRKKLPNLVLFNIIGLKLSQMAHELSGTGQVALFGLGQAFRLGLTKANLYGFVAIAIFVTHLCHNAWPQLNHGNRNSFP
jgi:hypothetical protein